MAGQYNFVLAAALVVGIPSFATIGSTIMAQDPNLRPLGVTRELLENSTGDVPSDLIAVNIEWGRDRDASISQSEMRVLIDETMAKRTDAYIIRFREVDGSEVSVSFLIGPNSYGPYTPRNMIYGMTPALAALQMAQADAVDKE